MKMTIAQTLTKINEQLHVSMYDNGYVVEANGINANREYQCIKIICATLDEVFMLLREASQMDRA